MDLSKIFKLIEAGCKNAGFQRLGGGKILIQGHVLKSSKCKIRNYKTPRGEHRQNTLRHKSQQDPL